MLLIIFNELFNLLITFIDYVSIIIQSLYLFHIYTRMLSVLITNKQIILQKCLEYNSKRKEEGYKVGCFV